jgi:hypothetical protein
MSWCRVRCGGPTDVAGRTASVGPSLVDELDSDFGSVAPRGDNCTARSSGGSLGWSRTIFVQANFSRVGAAVAAAEHPPVRPGLVVPAGAVHDPVRRFVRVAAVGPRVSEPRHVVVQRVKTWLDTTISRRPSAVPASAVDHIERGAGLLESLSHNALRGASAGRLYPGAVVATVCRLVPRFDRLDLPTAIVEIFAVRHATYFSTVTAG